MTNTKSARIAGFTFLFYIIVGIVSMVLFSQATGGAGITEKLAGIAHHTFQLRVSILLGLLQAVCAIMLAVTLYRVTCDQDSDLAMLALTFRVGEGLLGAIATRATADLLWLGTAPGPRPLDAAIVPTIGTYLLNGPNWNVGAIFFAMGSTLFSYLLLRGRSIPIPLAWLGVVASVLLLVGLPLELAGFLSGSVVSFMWIPMAAYEVPLGLWLLVKGVRTKTTW